MPLLLDNADTEALLDMPGCLSALRAAYQEVAAGTALAGRRSDIASPGEETDTAYNLKVMATSLPAAGVSVVRLTSDILAWQETASGRRRTKLPRAPGGRWVGLVLLFSTRTGEPLMIFPDGAIQRLRVGASSALAADRMARPDASVVAVIGSGWQAGGQALALAEVRGLSELRCFSPDPARRQAFCAEMGERLGVATRACASVAEAVSGADVVLLATNSMEPVLDAALVQPGQHVGSIRERELDASVVLRADRVVIHEAANMSRDRLAVARKLRVPDQDIVVEDDPLLARFAQAPSLAELLAGQVAGREAPDELNVFLNYHGLPVQFAAVGALLHERARAAGRGRELPAEWFTQDMHS